MLADINCCRKMPSVKALETLQIHVVECETVQLLQDVFSGMAKNWKKLKTLKVFLSFIVCLNRNRSALACELTSNNSLFVSQLYEDKRLMI